MQIAGIEVDDLSPQFDAAVANRVLLLDGDAACYQVTTTAKTLETALRQYVKKVYEYMFLANCNTVRIHLTSKRSIKCHRDWYPTFKDYQGNRAGKPKPPLLEPIRNAIAHSMSVEDGRIPTEWVVLLHDFWEADDGVVMDSYHYGDNGVVWSEDKDLRLCRGPYYEIMQGRVDYIDNPFGWIAEGSTPAGKLKVKGHGTKFFWAQMLMGDTADHVKGISKLNGKLCGERATLDFLMPIMSEDEAANKIIWAYAKNQQQFLPEAEVLWLRRHRDDSAYAYLKSLDLDAPLRQWLEDSHRSHEELFKANLEQLADDDEDC